MSFFDSLFGKSAPSIDPAQASQMLAEKPAPILIDVREPVEFEQAHVAGARLIPLGQIGSRLSEIPTGRRVLVICATGSRSSVAAKQLAQAGYDVLNVNGGVMGWMRQGLPLKTKGR